jgi:putative glutamine amidotransferase
MRPLIGITLDYVLSGSFSQRPHYAIRENYFKAITAAGGTAVGIPFFAELIDDYLSRIDALVVPGGDFALDPAWYIKGEQPAFPPTPRLKFDIEIIGKALAKNIPLLGICAGMQIMGGMQGCTLTADINKYAKTALCHLNDETAENYAHDVMVNKDSLLAKIVARESFAVNSRHKEGIVKLSDKVALAGKAEDGVIEAIEIKNRDFALGVQWHPEFFIKENEPNFKIFQALVKAAAK